MLLFSQNRASWGYLWESSTQGGVWDSLLHPPASHPPLAGILSLGSGVSGVEGLPSWVASPWSEWVIKTSNLIILESLWLFPWFP